MKLADGYIISFQEDEIESIKKEYKVKFLNNDIGYNSLIRYMNSLSDEEIEKYSYYGNKSIDINSILYDLKEDVFLESDSNLTLASVILNKIFKSLNMVIVDSKKANIKFENEFGIEDEESIYGKSGIKLGYLAACLLKGKGDIENYYKTLWAHYDFVFFKINDYRGILFQNPFYKLKNSFPSNLDLKVKTKLKENEFNPLDINSICLGDVSIDYYVLDLDQKQIEYMNHLGYHKEELSKKQLEYIKLNQKLLEKIG